MGSCMRRRSSAFPAFSFACSLLRIVCRSTVYIPLLLFFTQMCVKPRKLKVSGFPSPRLCRFWIANRPNSSSRGSLIHFRMTFAFTTPRRFSRRTGESKMKKTMATILGLALLGLPLGAQEKSDSKEAERLENCGTVLKEIMDIPDDIPQALIDKAECIIVYPSVLKAASVVGSTSAPPAMTCPPADH